MTNETSAERIQRKWDERAPEREARRKSLAESGPVQGAFIRLGHFAAAATSLLLLAAIPLGLVVLVIWFLIVTGGILLKGAGAVLIVVVVSLAWRKIRGG